MKNDINLVDEMYELLFTDNDTDAIKRPVLWTAYRRKDKEKVNCLACNSNDIGYIEGIVGCPYCSGKGYMWDQKLIEGYLYKQNEGKDRYNLNMPTQAGKVDTTSYVLITPFDSLPMIEDTIDILELTDNNKIQVPLSIESSLLVVYSRSMKASKNRRDYNVSFLGG